MLITTVMSLIPLFEIELLFLLFNKFFFDSFHHSLYWQALDECFVVQMFITYKRRLQDIPNVQKTSFRYSYRIQGVFKTFIMYKRHL